MGELERLLAHVEKTRQAGRAAREAERAAYQALEKWWERQPSLVRAIKIGAIVEVDMRPWAQWMYAKVLRVDEKYFTIERVLKDGRMSGTTRWVDKVRVTRVCTETDEVVRRVRAQEAAERLGVRA